jgi:membrane-associated phospholipid phosphatase
LTKHTTALITLLLLVLGPAAAHAELGTAADSLFLPQHRESMFDGKDIALAFTATAGVAVLSQLDRGISLEAPESNSAFARNLSFGAEKIGNPVYLAPVLGAVWLAGKASGHPGVSASALRIAGGMASSAAVSSVLKEVAGRARPYETPADPDEFHAFSGHTAFPSGHTTMAFSLASGIDHETRARWVPYVVYPLAGLVGWSRLRDNRHWTSDVVAGALVGLWTTHKFQVLARPGKAGSGVELDLAPGSASATYHF